MLSKLMENMTKSGEPSGRLTGPAGSGSLKSERLYRVMEALKASLELTSFAAAALQRSDHSAHSEGRPLVAAWCAAPWATERRKQKQKLPL